MEVLFKVLNIFRDSFSVSQSGTEWLYSKFTHIQNIAISFIKNKRAYY